jgi:hypothetical protein
MNERLERSTAPKDKHRLLYLGIFEIMAENPSGFQMSSSQFDQLAGEIDPHLYEVAHVMDSRE